MKRNPAIGRMILCCMVLMALMAGVRISRAQTGMILLKIDGINGEGKDIHKTLSASPNKSVTGMTAGGGSRGYGVAAGRLKAGTYQVQIVDEAGNAIEVPKLDASSKDAAKMAVKGQGASTTTITITSTPRDVATGQSSGKRQHSPLNIMKTRDMASPVFFTISPA